MYFNWLYIIEVNISNKIIIPDIITIGSKSTYPKDKASNTANNIYRQKVSKLIDLSIKLLLLRDDFYFGLFISYDTQEIIIINTIKPGPAVCLPNKPTDKPINKLLEWAIVVVIQSAILSTILIP